MKNNYLAALSLIMGSLVGGFAYGVSFEIIEAPGITVTRQNRRTQDLRETVNAVLRDGRGGVDLNLLTHEDLRNYVRQAVSAVEAVFVARGMAFLRDQVNDNDWNYLRRALQELRRRLMHLQDFVNDNADLRDYFQRTAFSPVNNQLSIDGRLTAVINELDDNNLNDLFAQR